MMRVGFQCAALALAFAAVVSGSAHAAELWYDGFSLTGDGGDYVVDAPLHGAAGGSGSFFSGNWVAQDPGDTASLWLSKGTGLSRSGLTASTVGGSASNDVDFDCCSSGRTARLFASPWGGFTDPDGTFYIGFLMNLGTGNAADPHHRTVEMHDGGFDDTLNRNLMFGISNFALGGNLLSLYVRDSVDNSTQTVVLSENADLDDMSFQGTHYVVLKFEMSTSTDDVVSVFLDPVGTSEPTPSASITVGQFLADRFTPAQFTFNSGDPSAAGAIDELRVGTEFADVAINTLAYEGAPVIPEPASLGLFTMGAMSLMLVARRTRT